MAEMRGFVFSIIFIVIFAGLLASVPAGLLGLGATPDIVTPVDPSIISGYSSYDDWDTTELTPYGIYDQYEYILGGRNWIFRYLDTVDFFQLGAKDYLGGVLWLGGMLYVSFKHESTNRGTTITFDEIDEDSTEGSVRYSLLFSNGASAGDLNIYYNTSLYSDSEDAFDNDELYFLHGVGFAESATSNIGSLLVGLLFLQLPDVPALITLLLATPIWACIIYVLWYVIKEMIPFV